MLLSPDVFLTQFSALQTSRSVRTRRLAAAEENTEVTRTARLAHIFKEICDMITSYKGRQTLMHSHKHHYTYKNPAVFAIDLIVDSHFNDCIIIFIMQNKKQRS